MTTLLLAKDACLWVLGSLSQLHRKPFSTDLVLRELSPINDLPKLLDILGRMGLRAQTRELSHEHLDVLPTPLLALLKRPVAGAATDAPSESVAAAYPAIVLKADPARVLLLRQGETQPVTLTREEFAVEFTGTALLASPTAEALNADPDRVEARASFGLMSFARELLKHRSVWRDVLLASLAMQLAALATPLLTQVVIDKVIVHHSTSTLQVVATALVLFAIFNGALSWVRQYLILHTGNRVDAVMGKSIFDKLLQLPVSYFEKRATGLVTTRIQAIETVRQFIGGAAVSLAIDTPFLLIFIAAMFYYSWQLTLIVLAMLGTVVVTSLIVTPRLRERMNHQFLVGARNQAFLTEYVSGISTVKSLQMEPQVAERYAGNLADYLEASFNARQLGNTYNVFSAGIEQLMTLLVLCVGAWLAMTTGNFTVGMLVAFQMFAGRVSGPVMRMVGLWLEYQQVAIAARRLGDIMDAPSEPYSLTPARSRNGDATVTLRDISFRYGSDRPYLYRGLQLTLRPGHCLALMGPSGSGKSTLAKLLLGFVQPSEGQILLGGLDIRHLSANELRSNFGVVPQESVLFAGSIYDNLLFANPHASFEQIVEACRMAEIHDTVEALPQGYQTRIGEHGAGLSGGQKQRLAIARALLKRPRILVFDEATSGLDAHAAEQIARTVNRLHGRVSILFIAHHLPRGLKVDEVITLGEGGQEHHLSVVNRQNNAPRAPQGRASVNPSASSEVPSE